MKRVVLMRPQGPRNVGAAMRALANFGPGELVLVKPARPSILIHPDFVQMAHGVEDVAEKVRVVDTIEEALEDCTRTYGFTTRARDHRDLHDWRDVRDTLCARCAEPDELVALVFGNEEAGLTTEETVPLQQLVCIPTSDEHGSINLAVSTAIVLSTTFLQPSSQERVPSAASRGRYPLPDQDRRFLAVRLKAVLGSRTTSASARRDLESSIERIFARTEIETRDARAWHLLLRALDGTKSPADYEL